MKIITLNSQNTEPHWQHTVISVARKKEGEWRKNARFSNNWDKKKCLSLPKLTLIGSTKWPNSTEHKRDPWSTTSKQIIYKSDAQHVKFKNKNSQFPQMLPVCKNLTVNSH